MPTQEVARAPHPSALARAGWVARAQLQRLAVWMLHHPLLVCLPVQAALLLRDLARLPPWGDEYTSLSRAALPFDALARVLEHNVHPTLYFVLLRVWLSGPCAADGIVCARALSACILLAATVVVDRLWLARLDARSRAWFLALWTASPFLLLYGRMARSYTLQLLLAALALEAGRRFAARPTLRRLLAYVAAAILLTHTHYLPGLAVVACVSVVMLWRQLRRPSWSGILATGAPVALIGIGFIGWVAPFGAALGRVGAATPYRVVDSGWLDAAAALGFTVIAFTIGESVRPWMIIGLLLLAAPLAVLVAQGVRQRPAWLAFVVPAALIAFVGARHWVSYAFVAGRLLFLVPFYLLLIVLGGRAMPRLRAGVGVALLLLSGAGVRAYFDREGFLNQAYVIPAPQMGRMIHDASAGADTIVIVDRNSCSLHVPTGDLPTRTLGLTDQHSFDAIAAVEREHPGPVWFVRGGHDASGQGWNRRVEELFAQRFTIRRTRFAPYSAFDRRLMRLAGWSDRPTHAVEVLEMRRREKPG
jgi:hypothetical protein